MSVRQVEGAGCPPTPTTNEKIPVNSMLMVNGRVIIDEVAYWQQIIKLTKQHEIY